MAFRDVIFVVSDLYIITVLLFSLHLILEQVLLLRILRTRTGQL